ncbi:MAG: hypothetical protein HZC26_03145 [Candidatus Magasanikbacteria bacterium]|nr:hypothetical protein [Candidatus Magasanikbacteria bacterium]
MDKIFKQALTVAIVTDAVDFLFHFFLTRPMESLTYFVIKFLLSFFVAAALFSLKSWQAQSSKKLSIVVLFGLIFSTLMSTYYRAWELGEARVPFGSRAPDIIGIARDNLFLFSGAWWLGHAMFFIIGVLVARRFVKS